MNRDQARTLFSAAYENELNLAEQSAFEALMAEDPQLREEYAAFRALFQSAAQQLNGPAAPDLMPGIRRQLLRGRRPRRGDRLRQLSGQSLIHPFALACIALSLLGCLWLAYSQLRALDPARPAPPRPASTPVAHDDAQFGE